jgi:hypothetical protein
VKIWWHIRILNSTPSPSPRRPSEPVYTELTPKPTFLFELELFHRQTAPDIICGYVNGIHMPHHNQRYSHWVLQRLPFAVSSMSNDCQIYTSCSPYAAVGECGTSCSSNSLLAKWRGFNLSYPNRIPGGDLVSCSWIFNI